MASERFKKVMLINHRLIALAHRQRSSLTQHLGSLWQPRPLYQRRDGGRPMPARATRKGSHALIDWLIQPLTYGFMLRGWWQPSDRRHRLPIIGCYVVRAAWRSSGTLFRMPSLPGVAISYLLGGNLLIGLLVAAVRCGTGHRPFFPTRRGQGNTPSASYLLPPCTGCALIAPSELMRLTSAISCSATSWGSAKAICC